jgi:hypothetical protein
MVLEVSEHIVIAVLAAKSRYSTFLELEGESLLENLGYF